MGPGRFSLEERQNYRDPWQVEGEAAGAPSSVVFGEQGCDPVDGDQLGDEIADTTGQRLYEHEKVGQTWSRLVVDPAMNLVPRQASAFGEGEGGGGSLVGAQPRGEPGVIGVIQVRCGPVEVRQRPADVDSGLCTAAKEIQCGGEASPSLPVRGGVTAVTHSARESEL